MYLEKALPAPGYWTAIEHGRVHHGDKEARAREWGRLKGQGVKTGISDIAIWYLRDFHAIELKSGGNSTSDAQDGFGAAMVANGFRWQVIRSVAALHDYLLAAGVPVLPSMRVLAMRHDAALTVAPPKPKAATRPPRQRNPTKADIKRANAWYAMEDNFK